MPLVGFHVSTFDATAFTLAPYLKYPKRSAFRFLSYLFEGKLAIFLQSVTQASQNQRLVSVPLLRELSRYVAVFVLVRHKPIRIHKSTMDGILW